MTETINLPLALFDAGIPFPVIGFIGNLLVVRIVHKTGEIHSATNYLLVSIAVGDFITMMLWPLYNFAFAKLRSCASFLRLLKSASKLHCALI